MVRWRALILVCLSVLGLAQPTRAAPARQVTPLPVEYTFGGQVQLRADIDTQNPISTVQAFLRSRGDTETYSGNAEVMDGIIRYEHDLTTDPLRAFSQVEYWFRIVPEVGDPYLTDTSTFFYEDNRFTWESLSSGSVTVHWYEGDIDFAQSVLNAAEAGIANANQLLILPSVQPVNFYVYATGLEMQSTLRLGGLRWIAGHADPDLGVSVVSLPAGPDQHYETDRQIPHELMHLLLYQAVGSSYYSLPIWFKEGLASANETAPSSDYFVILSSAVDKNTLIPLGSLCQTFPQDNTVYLAYAQSDSFVRFLYQHFGQAGLQNLLNSYAQGQGCENAPLSVFGLSLADLDQEWRHEALNDNILGTALENLLPWGVMFVAILLMPLLMVLINVRKSLRLKPAGQSGQAASR
jgi:hypothetical protein